jgi:hypothetical protein
MYTAKFAFHYFVKQNGTTPSHPIRIPVWYSSVRVLPSSTYPGLHNTALPNRACLDESLLGEIEGEQIIPAGAELGLFVDEKDR